MTIELIALHNLTSLAGTHTIDFTAEPLRSAGLFAITGDTGAGKSTLLDAVCLALYGTAPRLENVERLSQDQREDAAENLPELFAARCPFFPQKRHRRGMGTRQICQFERRTLRSGVESTRESQRPSQQSRTLAQHRL